MKIPEDEEQRNIIDKLANFVARNGPKFEELTKSKQQENPKFSFLFGGDYHEYYKWKVTLEATQAEAQKRRQQVKENKDVPPEPQKMVGESLPPTQNIKDEPKEFSLDEFKNLLQKLILVCTKDNIQNGKCWIVSNARNIDEMKKSMQYLLRRMLEEQLPFQQKLHIVYLANDILHHSRKKEMPLLQEALEEYILGIVALAYNGEAADCQDKLVKVLKIWETQKFFSDNTRQMLKSPDNLYDAQLDFIDKQRDEMNADRKKEQLIQQPTTSMNQMPPQNLHQPPPNFAPPDGFHHGPPDQHVSGSGGPFQQFEQWNRPPTRHPPPGGPPPQAGPPDPFHFYGNRYRPPPPQGGFPPFQQGFQEPGNFDHGGPPPPGFPPYQDGPPQQVQTFDYSHQSGPPPTGPMDPQQNGGAPVTFDYEHGNAPIPDGAPPVPQHDPTIPMAPYHDLPAGLMVPLVKLWDCEYKPLDPKDIRLPIPQPPSERLLAAIEAFYSPPSHDRPRDSQGWEKNGLFEFFKAKLKYIKDKERKLEIIERTPSPPPSRSSTPEAEGSPLVKERKRSRSRSRSASRSPKRSRSPRRRSYSRSRSRSRSRSYSRSRSRSASPRRSPIRRSPIRRSPTPPTAFVGFETRSLESKIEESNVGHQLLKKMGWGGQGLGKKETGIVDPIKAGEVRDNQDKFKGIGSETNDPFEQYRKTRSYTYGHRSSKR